jgi:hypothetical protein
MWRNPFSCSSDKVLHVGMKMAGERVKFDDLLHAVKFVDVDRA